MARVKYFNKETNAWEYADNIDKKVIDYNLTINKPSINGVELKNNLNLTDLNIQEKGDYAHVDAIPTSVSQLYNDSDYVTKEYVDNKFASIAMAEGGSF